VDKLTVTIEEARIAARIASSILFVIAVIVASLCFYVLSFVTDVYLIAGVYFVLFITTFWLFNSIRMFVSPDSQAHKILNVTTTNKNDIVS